MLKKAFFIVRDMLQRLCLVLFLEVGVPAGDAVITEAKSSSTAPNTKGQDKAFPKIESDGAKVVGKGKGPYSSGTKIPKQKVDIRRP